MLNLFHLRNSSGVSEKEQRRAIAVKDFLRVSQLKVLFNTISGSYHLTNKCMCDEKHYFSLKLKIKLSCHYVIETHSVSIGASDFHRKRNQMTLLQPIYYK